jgi:hypothetical protein
MPLPQIRQATGMSRRVMTKYLNLYARFNHPDFIFRMAKVRRMVEQGDPKKREATMMKKAKGGPNRFAALPARDVRLVQVTHLQQRFELALRSQLAEAVADRVNEVLAEHEAATGTRRLQPVELLVSLERLEHPADRPAHLSYAGGGRSLLKAF